MDIRHETIVALEQHPRTVVPGACIAINDPLNALRRHGKALLPIVEQVLSAAAVSSDKRDRHARVVRSNIRMLLVLYFAIADDNEWDTTGFLSSLPEHVFALAVSAIGNEWGINNSYRRRAIPKQLYECLKARLPVSNGLLLTLNRYIVVGMLTFDRHSPGCLCPPPRKYSMIDDMFQHALEIRDAAAELSRGN